jgi:predicted DNA-binding protein
MYGKTTVKQREYSFRIPLTEEQSRRFEKYIEDNGYKKTVIVRKAILEYLDRHEEDGRS